MTRRSPALLLSTATLLSLLALSPSFGQTSIRSAFGRSNGQWTMTGTVMADTVTYHATGSYVLGEQFFLLHMIDAALPPAYEASVYFGVDSATHEVVAHWLDSFGGAGARVVGLGSIAGDSVVVVYPYASARFRNTFLFRDMETWSLVIESKRPHGSWVPFASYVAVRRP